MWISPTSAVAVAKAAAVCSEGYERVSNCVKP